MAFNHFYYDRQVKKYLLQFMTVFAGMQVRVGKKGDTPERLIPVPVHYGSRDRVTAAIFTNNTQNKPLRLPVISAYLNSIDLAPELRKGIGAVRRDTYLPRGGILPDDITVVRQIMPVPYKATAEIALYTSNMDQHFQVIEQILILFDPILQIQTSDAPFDWGKITTIELTGIRFDENYPPGTDRRIINSVLEFTFPIYLSAPVNVKHDIVETIHIRLDATQGDTVEEHLAEQIFADEIIQDHIIGGDLSTIPELEPLLAPRSAEPTEPPCE